MLYDLLPFERKIEIQVTQRGKRLTGIEEKKGYPDEIYLCLDGSVTDNIQRP